MKGKINEYGNLEFLRKGIFKQQLCPFNGDGEFSCGDWCSLFGEPVISKWMGSPSPDSENPDWNLRICQNRVLYFDEFTDERKSK
uniref:Uncharacterized protein n=1 Tax=viral metagenome TaxID=1070528 RepID=A0A6M3KJK6_9ZZZZ